MNYRDYRFWSIQIFGWALLAYLVYAQGITAFDYELGVKMGTQEPASEITEVGTAFWYGFAFGDLVIYIPILALGLFGHLRGTSWARVVLGAGLGITIYWPIVSLAALVDARDAVGWNLTEEAPYWIVCLTIAIWGVWALLALLKEGPESLPD